MRMILLRAGCAMIAMTGAATLSHAQDTAAADGTTDQADAYHDEPSRDIVVTGVLPTARQDMLSGVAVLEGADLTRSEEHTSELQSLMRISYAVFCLKKKKRT